jgi:phage gp29-like protein
MQSLAEYHKFLCIAATPSLLGVLPENARDGVDENGQALTAEKAMSQALAGLANNSAIVVGHGGDVRPVFLQENDGAAFLKAFEYYDKQMTVAITSQALATADSQHASKAAGVEQKTIWDMVVEDLETGIAMTVQEDIIRPLVAYNWGEEIAEKYAPKFSMSAVEEADFGALAEGFSKLTGVDIIQPEHLPYVWAKLGLPVLRQGKRPAGRRNVA